MTSRERVQAIFGRRKADRTGFWLGSPQTESWALYFADFGLSTQTEVRQMLGDDYRWVNRERTCYKHPAGAPLLINPRSGPGLSAAGALAECESVQEIHDYPWPNPEYLDFTDWLAVLRETGDFYRASGFWCPFFHQIADLFGMENYFIKMFTQPDVVHAATRHLVDFYLEANRRLYDRAGAEIDGFFFGNDFGTQLDLLVGPEQMREFVFPYFKELTDQAHGRGYQVILHSCGAIHRVIPDLLAMGVDVLHPLQALAAHMDAETLARDFGGRVAFMGGIDTQQLLVHGSPEEVRADVRRVRRLLGPHLVVSPSHEALLPNVPAANVRAMAEAALE
jgi:uroporphyrinogen decarboxylase